MLRSSFAEECEADLFNEQAVVWGAVPEILIAGFDTLVEAGVSEEVAYMECVGELKLIAELIEARGIAGMREAISNTAELGAVLGGPRIVDRGRARANAGDAGGNPGRPSSATHCATRKHQPIRACAPRANGLAPLKLNRHVKKLIG